MVAPGRETNLTLTWRRKLRLGTLREAKKLYHNKHSPCPKNIMRKPEEKFEESIPYDRIEDAMMKLEKSGGRNKVADQALKL